MPTDKQEYTSSAEYAKELVQLYTPLTQGGMLPKRV
jgi:hypothetical protein